MNAQMAVPIADIARFKRMTMICDDHTLLTSLIPAVGAPRSHQASRARHAAELRPLNCCGSMVARLWRVRRFAP